VASAPPRQEGRADVVDDLLTHPSRRYAMGRAGCERAAHLADPGAHAAAIEAVNRWAGRVTLEGPT
jgi:hypothetical protein